MARNDVAGASRPRSRRWTVVLLAAALWALATIGLAILIHSYAKDLWPGITNRFVAPSENQLGTIVEVVPAVVVAIFVFAAGTSFVVAQVVPPARGTRAVELLRARHVEWTIAPALALMPLSALVVVIEGALAVPLASALLVGSVVYLLVATWCLLGILGEATDPHHYAKLVLRKHNSAMRKLRVSPVRASGDSETNSSVTADPSGATRESVTPQSKRAVNAQYETIRALRGWTRTAATSGDSRELHVSLEATLQVVADYASLDPKEHRKRVPTNYEHNAQHYTTNPLDAERRPSAREQTEGDETLATWVDWVPRSLRSGNGAINRQDPAYGKLARTWVANEVGRSLVRAVEFAATSKTLLERDRGRLLNSLEKAARRFCERDDGDSAGVLVAYLIELGLGARRCPPEEILWHFEPLIALAHLHSCLLEPPDPKEKSDLKESNRRNLQVGTAAGVLKVAEAITAARIRQHYEQNGPRDWPGTFGNGDVSACARTVQELRQVPGIGAEWRLFRQRRKGIEDHSATDSQRKAAEPGSSHEPGPTPSSAEETLRLAKSDVLEPRDQPLVYPTDGDLIAALGERLLEDASTTLQPGPDPAAAIPARVRTTFESMSVRLKWIHNLICGTSQRAGGRDRVG
ncbi:hypothetical protein [Nocardioides immobilis]|uniref:hypothetical protein n=1 Tax=Nocardioides immobilis TaxID=2049295 RepID=UPI0011C4A744|nr:hypothetical protein [Nocardioides immobilis]